MNKMFKSKQKVENFTEQQISEGHLSWSFNICSVR